MEKEKTFIFKSNVVMTSDRYEDVSLITYSKYVAFLQVVSAIFGFFYLYQVIYGKNYELLCINSGFLLVMAFLILFTMKGRKVEQFEKSFRQKDGTITEYDVLFTEDSIKVELTSGIKGEYTYDKVKALKESENLYFLELAKDFHVVVNKDVASEQEFAQFIFSKCLKLREKRIIDLRKDKRSHRDLIILLGAAFAIAMVLKFTM